ncbi:BCCT family transporter [Roseinatronobacter sp. S2]|uniref:BCCT family transporter n=1 Tax=Roseinatronobacter sp. S2 TaxID=3035471 RepID=UPI0024101F92|nr:BCCT family transporter [Roseinatronobacter sp. S2]WFE76518.1 BCCT family transporter [Roseinatronobacter sp. S2]
MHEKTAADGQVDQSRLVIGKSGLFRDVNPPMATLSKLLVIAFVLAGVMAPEAMGRFFEGVQSWITVNMSWYYILSIAMFITFVFGLIFSRYGAIRLGKDSDRPEFSTFAWFSMLFGAGMGIGLLFWSVAEPMYHVQNAPFLEDGTAGSMAGSVTAMQVTFLHWGLHGWAVYVIVGMSLAYFSYRKGLPLTIRASLYPILGDRIYGNWGHLVDLLAIFGTIFGVATTLGLGAGQIQAGLNHLFGVPMDPWIRYLIIMVISAIATLSAVSGVGRGIKILSEMNMWLSIFLIIVFILVGPTVFLLGFFITNIGEYIVNVIPMGLWVNPDPESGWQGAWTVFYWGWWIAWAPFVGMFIARVSRGRTIREFAIGVLIVPTLITFFWMSIFGGTALYQEFVQGGGIIDAVNEDISKPLFLIIENFGLGLFGSLMSFVALILIITYFVTSSDSGTLVVTTLISMGKEEPPVTYRVFWGIGEGAVAAVLLASGGLAALQTASLAAGLPFSIIMFLMMWGLFRALSAEPAPHAAAHDANMATLPK